MEHDRFDFEHRRICTACHDGYLDFIDEQNDDARLDAMINEEQE